MTSYRVIYIDHDKKCFSISLPVIDDTKITDSTVSEQTAGRNVNIATVSSDRFNECDIISCYENQGYSLDNSTKW